MDENKDLKKIKEQVDSMKGQHCQSPRYSPADIILAAASRMAKEVKTKDGALTFALLEVDRLKAELEKRPEVVKCGECYKNGNANECPFAWVKANNHTGIILYDSTSFCSYGEIVESEETK